VSENQNVEYRQSRRDECLTWVCGPANATVGVLDVSLCGYEGIVWNPGRLPDAWTIDRLLPQHPSHPADATGVQVTFPTGTRLALSRHQVDVLRKSLSESKLVDLMGVLGRRDRTKFRNQVLRPLLEEGLVEMSRPDTPTSSKQTYRITPLGRTTLARIERAG